MKIYQDLGQLKIYNYSHLSGHAGRVEEYYNASDLLSVHFFINGKLHREDGPAVIVFDLWKPSRVFSRKYYLNGVRVNYENSRPTQEKYFQ